MNTPIKNIILGIITAFLFCLSQSTIGQSIKHQYDNLNRLTETKYGNNLLIQYNYDELGNRIKHIINLNTFQTSISIDGNMPFCEGEAINLTASNGTSYEWNTGSTDSTLTVTTSGTYTVTVTNDSGLTAEASQTVTTIPPPPPPFITTDDPTTICEGQSVEIKSSQLTDVHWNTGAYAPSILTTTSGDYWATNIDDNDCESALSNIISVNILTSPDASITANGATEFCEGEEVELTADGGDSYFWYASGALFDIGESIIITQDGNYFVIASLGGCLDTAFQTVTVYDLPPEPTIDFDGNVLTSSNANSYQWLLNGNPISGATNQNYAPIENGLYTIEITDQNGCINISNPPEVILNSIEKIAWLNTFNIYPNPSSSLINIEFSSSEKLNEVELTLYNTLGQVVYSISDKQLSGVEYKKTIDVKGLPEGVYLLNLKINNHYITQSVSVF